MRSTPASGRVTYGIGEELAFTVTFSESVTVDNTGGTPTLAVRVGAGTGGLAGTSMEAAYQSGSPGTALVFGGVTVVEGHLDPDGVSIGRTPTPLELNGGTITATTGGSPVDRDIPVGSYFFADAKVDGVRPGIEVDGAVVSMDGMSIEVRFDEALHATVGGTWTLLINEMERSHYGLGTSGDTVTMHLALGVLAGDRITVSYTDPTPNDDTAATQDLAGNDALSFAAWVFNTQAEEQGGGSVNLNLSTLSVSPGTLKPTFTPSRTHYNVRVPYEVDTLTVTATGAHSSAGVRLIITNSNNTYVTISGTDVSLVEGPNNIIVEVSRNVAGGTRTKTYTIYVWRSPEGGDPVITMTIAPVKPGPTLLTSIFRSADSSIPLETTRVGQGFRTPQTTRYVVDAITVNFETGPSPATPSMTLRRDSPTGTEVATLIKWSLIRPNSGSVLHWYAVEPLGEGIPLDLNTAYFIVLEGGTDVAIRTTQEGRNGGLSRPGWDFTGNAWEPPGNSFADPGAHLMVAVHGEPEPGSAATAKELTAELRGAPEEHDGATPFSVELHLSEEVDIGWRAMRDHVFTVEHAAVTGARRLVEGSNQGWEITITPEAAEAVSVLVTPKASCDDEGALCTADGRGLANGVGILVPSPQAGAFLTAAFANVPAEHDGSSPFTIELGFSEDLDEETDNRVLQHAVTATEATVTEARRLEQGSHARWEITVQPSGSAPVEIGLSAPASCDASGALCTADGRALSNSPSATVDGPGDEPGVAQDPLTASFDDVPPEHDGSSAFTFGLTLSEEPAADFSYVTLRDHAFDVTNGSVRNAGRREEGQNRRWTITVEPDSRKNVVITLEGDRACDAAGAICTDDGRKLSNSPSATVDGPGDESPVAQDPLTASFDGVPSEHDGSSAFTFGLTLSEEPAADFSYVTLRDHAFDVTNGSVRGASRREQGQNRRWTVTVEPDSREDVVITLEGDRACDAAGAICTDDGRKLSNRPSATVEGPPSEPLTASFGGMPSEHDGSSAFTFGLTLSEEPAADFSYVTLRDHAFDVTNGSVRKAGRQEQGQNRRWTITVEPASSGTVTIELPATRDCGASGAICTDDGRQLSNSNAATVAGPVGISVADARVEEDEGALLAFEVTLSRPASSSMSVDYSTSDGSAQASVDYTAASGTLTFQSGESSKTIEVAVLDDAHDEGEETLTLTLSNASSGRLSDAEATGTIKNRDPLPRALLARFGRTAAVHVVEHVEERIEAPRRPGFRGRFAGRELQRGMERDMALSFLNRLGGMSGMQPAGMGGHATPGGSPAAGVGTLATPGLAANGIAARPNALVPGAGLGARGGAMGAGAPPGGFNGGGLLQMGLGGDLLTGSDFALNRESRGGVLSFWSRGARSYFSGREGALSLGGDVRTTMFGADYAKGPLVTGLSLSHSRGLGEYLGTGGGQVASAVTGLYPWLGYRATDRVTVWGVAGYGAGGMLLTPDGAPALESDLSMAMAAAGTRGDLVAGGTGGFELAFKADALWVGTSTDGVDGPAGRLVATAAAVTRFRTGLEGSRDYALAGRLSLTPSVEVGLRHDGGDAETGAGMDMGAGVVVSDASTGLAVDVRVRTLVVHQAEGFRERGIALSVSYNPTPSTPLGFVARVAPSWGGQATSGAQALWGRETMAGIAHGGFAAGNRLDGEVGYGLPVGSRFVGTPRVGFSTSEYGRDYRVGYGLAVLDSGNLRLELGVDAQRRESPMLGGTSNGVLGRAAVGW